MNISSNITLNMSTREALESQTVDNNNPFTLSNIDYSSKLGTGTYGSVYSTKDGRYAYKKFRHVENIFDEHIYDASLLVELSVMKALADSPRIVDFHEVIFGKQSSGYFMTKYCDTLKCCIIKCFIRKCCGFDYETSKSMFYQLLLGLYDLHSKFICHADIKPDNILLEDRNIIIADCGISQFIKIRSGCVDIQTLWYRAPEILLGAKKYDFNVDIWSAGLVFMEMVTGKVFLPGDTVIDQLYKIFALLGTPSDETWPGVTVLEYYKDTFPHHRGKTNVFEQVSDPDMIDLLKNVICMDPGKRFSASQALNHKVFDDLREGRIFREINKRVEDYESLVDNIKYIETLPRFEIEPDFMSFQPELELSHRQILINWLEDVVISHRLGDETFHLIVEYLDYFISKKSIPKVRYQLVGIASVHLASAVNNDYQVSVGELEYLCAGAYSVTDITDMINLVAKTIDYQLYCVISKYYFTEFEHYLSFSEQDKLSVKYVISNSAKYPGYRKYNSKTLVIAACFIILADFGDIEEFKKVKKIISKEDLHNVVSFLITCHKSITKLSGFAKKYSSSRLGEISKNMLRSDINEYLDLIEYIYSS